jgi:hypothetical protein
MDAFRELKAHEMDVRERIERLQELMNYYKSILSNQFDERLNF